MEELLKKFGVGPRPIDDPFFDDSYKVCKVFERKGITVVDDEELCHEFMKEFPCNASGCRAVFRTLIDFEIHYNGVHRYVCVECKKSRPNARLLEIHIQETHDSFFKLLAERQAMYQCYEAECKLKFKNPCERREHCTIEHKFPKNFRFDDVSRRRSKERSKNDMEVDRPKEGKQGKPQKIVTNLNKNQKCKTFRSVNPRSTLSIEDDRDCNSELSISKKGASSLGFVPRQVVQKSYLQLPNEEKVNGKGTNRISILETESLMDLAASLPKEI